MERIKLVIFDMDGLMFDTERRYCQSAVNLMNKKNVDIDISVLYEKIGTSLPLDMKRLNKSNVADDEIKRMFEQSAEQTANDMCVNGVPVKPGLYELLDELDKYNVCKVVASSTKKDRVERLLKATNVYDRFEVIITGEDAEKSKPYPDIFLEACSRVNIDPNNALVLEDSNNGGLAAKNANIRYVIVSDIKIPSEEVIRGAIAIVRDLNVVAETIHSYL